LINAFQDYLTGFAESLYDYYSGFNALGLLAVIVRLAELEADAWEGNIGNSKNAESALEDYLEQLIYLRGLPGCRLIIPGYRAKALVKRIKLATSNCRTV
jgi:hypothetical protein